MASAGPILVPHVPYYYRHPKPLAAARHLLSAVVLLPAVVPLSAALPLPLPLPAPLVPARSPRPTSHAATSEVLLHLAGCSPLAALSELPN